MASGWIDVHGHFTPPTSSKDREARWHAMREAKFLVPEPFEWTPESTLSYLDSAGIAMQMLSNLPKQLDALKESNNYAASLVKKHPSRFGLLAALPTDDSEACLEEIERATGQLNADGFAVTCCYNGVYLGDSSLNNVWAELNRRHTTIFVHPDAYASASLGRPSPLIEVAFETTRTVVDMLYAGVFRRYPKIRWILAHCGGALPVLSGRLKLLGTEPWVPNPNGITQDEIKEQLASLYLDTAATAPTGMAPALHMVSADHLVYGADCGVPCSTEHTMEANKKQVLEFEGLTSDQRQAIGRNVLSLFPSAAARLGAAPGKLGDAHKSLGRDGVGSQGLVNGH
ncbi:6-methylsalicylate decarboxylase, partial [Lecanoromycetidae sp. Uapishka_2]